MDAISSSLLANLQAGDEIIATVQLYGGTYRLMRDIFPRMGIRVHHVGNNLDAAERLVTTRTRVLYTETPTNPTLRLVDLRKAAALAHKHKLLAYVDNTFATPVLQNPATLGATFVLHSGTKFLGGHGDVLAGVVATTCAWAMKLRQVRAITGAVLHPLSGYLLHRGLQTLPVRVRAQQASAQLLAERLRQVR